MQQTSSRLLRMTEEDRPFTRDSKDLFSTLMVSLKLETIRVRFTRYDFAFTSEEALHNLSSLKFSQSNRIPDPKDPSRIVTTTTTTTFSMSKEIARSICQRFIQARFFEPVNGRTSTFPSKGGVYQLTPKGVGVLQRFCQRNGITSQHVLDLLASPRNSMTLLILERDSDTDHIATDQPSIEVIFRRFAGQGGPNDRSSSSDSDSARERSNGIIGVRMAKDQKIDNKVHQYTFTGRAAIDWLMDCCTTIDERETCRICTLFLKYDLIAAVQADRAYVATDASAGDFQPTNNAIYAVTERGQRVCGLIASLEREKGSVTLFDGQGNSRDSNKARLNFILQDPSLRLLFREYLGASFCEENLSFYCEVSEWMDNYARLRESGSLSRRETMQETLATAYGLYNAFLAFGSPCELNIEHGLRNSIASQMTKAVGNDETSLADSLKEVVNLFELAQTSIFKLMASDSVPKFCRVPKYAILLQEYDFDVSGSGRSSSPAPGSIHPRSRSRVR